MPSKLPTLSIVIPCYNQGKYLATALASIKAQDFLDWECIIIDDGSTDNTVSIAKDWQQQDARFSYISQPNQGLSNARNSGLKRATGTFVHFLDSDDYILPGFYTQAINTLQLGVDVIYSGWTLVDVNQQVLGEHALTEEPNDMFHFMLTRCLCPCHALIFKRSLFTNAGYFDETMRSCEDWDMWLRITATGARFKRIDGFFACYRMQPESMTCNYNRMLSHGYRVITKHSHLHKNCQSCIQAAQHGKRNFSYYVWNLTQGPQVNRLYNERSYWRLLCNLVSCSKADKLWLWWGIRRIGRLVRDTVRNHDNKP